MPRVKSVLALAAVGEIATGVTLLLAPSLVGQWLFATDLVGIAATIARVTGIALIGLGVACWPGTPRLALYLAYVGYSGGPSGRLLWPVVAAHIVLAAFVARGIARDTATRT